MKPLHLANSPLTIFAGHVLKGNRWAAGKQDALLAVAEHVVRHGQPVELSDEDTPVYRSTVDRLGGTSCSQ